MALSFEIITSITNLPNLSTSSVILVLPSIKDYAHCQKTFLHIKSPKIVLLQTSHAFPNKISLPQSKILFTPKDVLLFLNKLSLQWNKCSWRAGNRAQGNPWKTWLWNSNYYRSLLLCNFSSFITLLVLIKHVVN